jgi:hypothetical protein
MTGEEGAVGGGKRREEKKARTTKETNYWFLGFSSDPTFSFEDPECCGLCPSII